MKFSNINPKYKKNLWKGIVILLITALINLTEIKVLFNWALSVNNVNIDVADLLIDLICDILFAIGTAFIISYYTSDITVSEKVSDLLSKRGKKETIKELLDSETVLQSYKIDKIYSIVDTNEEYRTNTSYVAHASIQNGKVIVETTMSYIAHIPENESFEPISVRYDDNSSKINYIKIINPNNSNDFELVQDGDIKYSDSKAHGDGLIYEGSCKIPNKFKNFKTLAVEKKYTFFGEDHWINYGVVFAHLSEGIRFNLTTSPELKIKEVTIFEKPDLYCKTTTDTNINIQSTQWLSRYGGFTIIIGKNE